MKLIIWDLDETLWDGTIYYEDGIKLKPETKEVLKQISKIPNIIQYVCTHNEMSKTLIALEKLDMLKYFKGIKATTGQEKDITVQEILQETGYTPEETLFIDDSPLNRELVRLKVNCHVDYFTDLYEVFKYLDTDRLKIMNQQRNRMAAENAWQGDKKDFLKLINTELVIDIADSSCVKRITDLANRTNEMNATRNRYTEDQIENIINDDKYDMWVGYLSDKFGDYGLIAEVIIQKIDEYTWDINDFSVSCRTIGRGVGSSIMKHILSEAKENNITKILGRIRINTDDWRMTKIYEKYGFIEKDTRYGFKHYELEVK
jgi:FkbH-like protein